MFLCFEKRFTKVLKSKDGKNLLTSLEQIWRVSTKKPNIENSVTKTTLENGKKSTSKSVEIEKGKLVFILLNFDK